MKDAVTMKAELKKLIDTAAGRIPADLVIKNCKVVNVFSGKIQEGDIAFSGDHKCSRPAHLQDSFFVKQAKLPKKEVIKYIIRK